MTTFEKLLTLLQSEIPSFDPSKPLTSQFDSLSLLELIPKIEKQFGIEIYSVELSPLYLDRLETLAALIEGKLSQK